MKHEFQKPYTFEDKEYTEINLDLDGLTGRDISEAKKVWTSEGGFAVIPAVDSDFCAAVAARAAKLPLEFFLGLPAKEYTKITQAVSNFLIA